VLSRMCVDCVRESLPICHHDGVANGDTRYCGVWLSDKTVRMFRVLRMRGLNPFMAGGGVWRSAVWLRSCGFGGCIVEHFVQWYSCVLRPAIGWEIVSL
jgi:hypothetical protein